MKEYNYLCRRIVHSFFWFFFLCEEGFCSENKATMGQRKDRVLAGRLASCQLDESTAHARDSTQVTCILLSRYRHYTG